MSTFKKLLALTLALAMVLSVSAFAGYKADTYKDAAGIDEDCEDAIELLYALDIMKGDANGNFNPTATITRAEVAKMIYVILNYGKDDKAVNYTGAKLFSDVAAGAWYEGYVNYAATTKLVQGRGNGTFGPNDPVTTAEAAKMLLTAIGYSAEARGYVGAGWDKQVLSDAAIIGLLDGYNYSTTTYAPRQWVAVMFKNALTDALTYGTIAPVIFNGLLTGSTLPVYAEEYPTMGAKYFGLYKFAGVIVANEYADLYGAKSLSTDNTQICYKVDNKLVKNTFKNWSTDLTEIDEYRWGYAVEDGTKDLVVYVGGEEENTTFSTGEATTLSGRSFKSNTGLYDDAEYFVNFDPVVKGQEAAKFEASVNGDWLKVIDNNGDGYADYVFKTTFTMSKISDITRKGDYITLTGVENAFDMDYVVTGDELAEGDIVVWTTIDGTTYIDLAEIVTETISKKGISNKYETITCGDNVYGQSYINNAVSGMEDVITKASTQTTYDLYLDHFGFVRLYTETAYDNGFILLTDAFFETDGRDSSYVVEYWDIDDGDYAETAVTNSKPNYATFFVNKNGIYGDKTWGRLFTANETYTDVNSSFLTNVAGYIAGDEAYTLLNVEGEDAVSNKIVYDVVELTSMPTKVTSKHLAGPNGTIQATTDTVYYFVAKTSWGSISAIYTWTGYSNAVSEAILHDDAVAYAVTTDGQGAYDVAEVVVFESKSAVSNDLYFVYDYDNYGVYAVGYDSEAEAYAPNQYVAADDNENGKVYVDEITSMIDFYTIYSNEKSSKIVENYADEGVYAATVLTNNDINKRDYIKVDLEGSTYDYFYEDKVDIYTVSQNSRGYYSVEEAIWDLEIGDKLIIVYNSDGDILYIINASQSLVAGSDTEALSEVIALWNRIADDANKVTETYTVNGVGSYEAGKKVVVENLTGAYAKVESTKADVTYVPVENGKATITVTGNMTVTGGLYKATFVKADKSKDVYAEAGERAILTDGIQFFTLDGNDTIYAGAGQAITLGEGKNNRVVYVYDAKVTIAAGTKSATLNDEAITLAESGATVIVAFEGDVLSIVDSANHNETYTITAGAQNVPTV